MTAEVAVLNKHAIVLAADSAVSMSSGKIYNSASKLFSLSKFHPVGVMFYSMGSIMNLPVETVVKVYREGLGHRCFDTVEGYADDFFRFLQENDGMFTETSREKHYWSGVQKYCAVIKTAIEADLRGRVAARRARPTNALATAVATEQVASHHGYLSQMPFRGQASQTDVNRVKALLRPRREEIAGLCCGRIRVSAATKNLLLEVASSLYARKVPTDYTGVVFGGFGDRQYLPSLRSYRFAGCAYQLDTSDKWFDVDISDELPAWIQPFAQSDVAEAFLHGRAPDFSDVAANAVKGYLNDLLPGFPPDTPAESIGAFEAMRDDLVSDLRKKLAEYSQHAHYWPLIFTVASAPKDELSKIAEALVNITSLKRRVTSDKETVGGPVDVAVISKGDGLIWTQRKHYFDEKLNPHFMRNYFRGIDGQEPANQP